MLSRQCLEELRSAWLPNLTDPGLLHDGDPAVQIFTDHGWRWGGDWRTPKDYQHFERRNQ